MNQTKIRKLAHKAAGGWLSLDAEGEWRLSEKEVEKFAELIVRECADIAKHHVMNISTYADADFVYEQIREHFGVDE
jgi:hypothetical protein